MKNLTEYPVILAFKSKHSPSTPVLVRQELDQNWESVYRKYFGNEEAKSQIFNVNDDEENCPEAAFDIVKLLQEVLEFRLTFKEIQSQSKINVTVNDSQHFIYCHPSLEQLSETSVFLFPTFQSRLSALYKSSGVPADKDLFVRNVTGNLWLYLVGTLILLTVCLRLSTYIHHRLKPRHGDWSWLEVVQWSLGAICQQGSERHPQGCSCRTMFLIGYMITYMNYTGFAAGITSLLAVNSDAVSLPWQRILHAHLPLVALCDSHADKYLKDIVRDSKDLIYPGCVDTMEKLLTKAKDKSVALMSESRMTHYLSGSISEETRCDMSTSTQDRYNYFTGFVVNRRSPLRQPFNYWLLRFKETGLLKRTQRKWFKPAPVCQTQRSYTQVGFEHVQSAFFIMECCTAAALLVVGFEILLVKYRTRILKKVLACKRQPKLKLFLHRQ